jgi:predicted adenine nucleotide alpha hydrolase (AANH) superfamily ATPase
MKKKLLIHICCAPDATIAIDRLQENYAIKGIFYNPNIHPQDEYDRRKKAMDLLAEQTGFKWTEAIYDPENWYELTEGLEHEPEKGARCEKCIKMRLRQTARVSLQGGFDAFAAVLTVSPHKDADMVNRLGIEAGKEYGIEYVPTDLKKQDGFKRSIELSKKYGLYRQNYCGCVFSLRSKKSEDSS